MSKKDQGGKNKKYGRNKIWCQVYSTRHIRDKNRVRRIRRHLKNFPCDLQSKVALG